MLRDLMASLPEEGCDFPCKEILGCAGTPEYTNHPMGGLGEDLEEMAVNDIFAVHTLGNCPFTAGCRGDPRRYRARFCCF